MSLDNYWDIWKTLLQIDVKQRIENNNNNNNRTILDALHVFISGSFTHVGEPLSSDFLESGINIFLIYSILYMVCLN